MSPAGIASSVESCWMGCHYRWEPRARGPLHSLGREREVLALQSRPHHCRRVDGWIYINMKATCCHKRRKHSQKKINKKAEAHFPAI